MSKKVRSGLGGLITFAVAIALAGCSGTDLGNDRLKLGSRSGGVSAGQESAEEGSTGEATTLVASGESEESKEAPAEEPKASTPEEPKDSETKEPPPPEEPKEPASCTKHSITACAESSDLKQQALAKCAAEGSSLVEKAFGAPCEGGVSGINFTCCK